jgi:hypothetical protein
MYSNVISPVTRTSGLNWSSHYAPSTFSFVELDPEDFIESLELGPASNVEEVNAEYKFGWNNQPSLEKMEGSGLIWRLEGDARSERLALGEKVEAARSLLSLDE